MSKSRFIREYLTSLKEDKELDYIFPLLLEAMNFRVVTTPLCSKGQSQYGKDVVAIGKAEDGLIYRWYFELKGNAAKDINDTTFMEPDGVRESILAAKDVPFKESGIPYFDNLPVKIVFVHNGILQENTRPQYEGFIAREFPDGGFERWGIEKLVNLFGTYMFDESMLYDAESYKLIMKILLQCEAPGWSADNLRMLIQRLCSQCKVERKREVVRTLAALKLVLTMILDSSREAKNLLPAKESSDVIVLLTWAWILRNNLETKQYVIESFNGMAEYHLSIYVEYLQKILPLAKKLKGLHMRGGEMERVFYPMRCYDFLADLLYFYYAVKRRNSKEMIGIMQEEAMHVIEVNSGFDVMTLDTQSIPLLMLMRFLFIPQCSEETTGKFVEYMGRVLGNLLRRYRQQHMFPELYGNRIACAKSLYGKSDDYEDKSSLLLVVILEIITWFGFDAWYDHLRKAIVESKVNLQVAYPISDDELEIHLFEHRLMSEMCVETSIQLPETLEEFKKSFVKKYDHMPLRTEKVGYGFLTVLAHKYYRTDMFPDFLNLGFVKPLKEEKVKSYENTRSKQI